MSNEPAPYWSIRSLEHVYLEDSYVLDVEAHPRRVMFQLDVILTEEHPEYTVPKPGERYCYRRARLLFEEASEVHWSMSDSPPTIDPTGEIDYGNIEAFTACDDRYELIGEVTGEWGNMTITSSPPVLTLE